MLKIASPGVPDFYQGTELWDLSLVDPDNRRPVDFDAPARRRSPRSTRCWRARRAQRAAARSPRCSRRWHDGSDQAAGDGGRPAPAPRRTPELFLDGEYLPLDVGPPFAGAARRVRAPDGDGERRRSRLRRTSSSKLVDASTRSRSATLEDVARAAPRVARGADLHATAFTGAEIRPERYRAAPGSSSARCSRRCRLRFCWRQPRTSARGPDADR